MNPNHLISTTTNPADMERLVNNRSQASFNSETNYPTDTERLVKMKSENSFNAETNELTVTHSIGDRRFSKMCIKPLQNNTMDIVITNTDEPNYLSSQMFGSRDIRKKYSGCAKLGLSCVLIVLIIMLIVMVTALLASPSLTSPNSTNNVFNSSVNVHSIEPFVNDSSVNVTSLY